MLGASPMLCIERRKVEGLQSTMRMVSQRVICRLQAYVTYQCYDLFGIGGGAGAGGDGEDLFFYLYCTTPAL